MQSFTFLHQNISTSQNAPPFPHIATVNRLTVPTDAAAYYLNRRPQTLRFWASSGRGPIEPIHLNGRLAWPINEIKALLTKKGGNHGS